MLTAAVLAVVHPKNAEAGIVVLCPYCNKRHWHHWWDPDEAPGIRQSHCRKQERRLYLIGRIPDEYLMDATLAVRRVSNLMFSTPWIQRLTSEQAERIADAAYQLADEIDELHERMQTPPDTRKRLLIMSTAEDPTSSPTRRLRAALDPQTDRERCYTEWLLRCDQETIETVADMIERRVRRSGVEDRAMVNRSGRGRIKRTNSAAAERHAAIVRQLWAEEQQRLDQQQIDDAAICAAYLAAKPKEQQMTTQPLTLPPGTERQHWQLVLGALLAQTGQDDAISPAVLDELRASSTGGGPLVLALSATVATQLAQQYDDPISIIREHLAQLAVEDGQQTS